MLGNVDMYLYSSFVFWISIKLPTELSGLRLLHVITGLGCPDAWQWIDTESPNIFVVSFGSVIHDGATVLIKELLSYKVIVNILE